MVHGNPGVVVLAPDKFKGSLTAPDVADALAAGIRRVVPTADIRLLPVADGGDGTVAAFVAAGWEAVPIEAVGPTGEPVTTSYAVHAGTAVIELATVVGLERLPGGRPEPLRAGTYGLGLAIRHALDHDIRSIVLGLGGSASTDGGAGLLQALGLCILDAAGREIPSGGAALVQAARVDRSGLHPALAATTVTLATDVDNPLLGSHGAAAVFGPQKGAGPTELAVLEAGLTRWAELIGAEHAGRPGAGAAGGTGFGAMAVLGAVERPGIDVVLELIDFETRLRNAALVITGEGSLDEQSLHGKAPMGVATAARAAGVPVVAVAGRCLLDADRLHAAGFTSCHTLLAREPDPARSMTDAARLLTEIGADIAATHLHPADPILATTAPDPEQPLPE
ncbi:glycerate kinase [Nocardia sp. alder85J]|uniref:glycerate kinase n=1 Tax=Nocardia sp. alder85J TaxID=2862949 RepID=UPI001CD562F9|nr:glycerate kinase [Nocardia sp. alder85J]MCX4096338.1 glycerate kinase [Nocardia sp. alder85J]